MNPDHLILKDKGSASHDSAETHVSGASEFVDDRPAWRGELHVGLVWSPHAKARVLGIHAEAALAIPDVACVLTHRDVHHACWGTIFEEQPFLAADEVNYVGEVVAVVGARTKAALQTALRSVRVDYEVLKPILSIDDAIQARSFIGVERFIERGDADAALRKSSKKLAGRLIIRGAEHFYLENQAAIAYPLEGGRIEVHSSTQHPTETQHLVADALGLQQNEVVCVTKRLGGGFGGKETQAAPFAVYAAMVAKATGKPARIVLSKDDDMIITGKRNPFQVDYEVAFENDGSIEGLKARFFSDGGAYADLSTAIMERALLHADNAYFIPNVRVSGQVCRTNFHSHTAFRGFGGPKGVALIERIMEDIAAVLKRDPLDVRQRNVYQGPDRDRTHYGQKVENNMLPRLFTQLEASCRYRERRLELEEWNRDLCKNPRGLAMTAIKFGISFTTRFLNQGNALINIHRDGSIQVSTGAVEMGQGVNTRIAKLVADELGLDLKAVRVMVTSTEKNANTSPTAASSGTDINGAAAVLAAQAIRRRLSELLLRLVEIPRENWAAKTAGLGTMPEISLTGSVADDACVFQDGKVFPKGKPDQAIPFATLVAEAYFNRISLSEYGYYKIPDLGFNKITGQGQAFLYFTQGVACSEVEIDRWTGEAKVLRSDILMDLGRPVNQQLDIGQISGAFVQGMGWVTTEALYYDAKGKLLSHSPSTYKIPSVQDTPRIFHIDLIPNEDNVANVKGTKAVGEPPLMLCFSVWNAIRDALLNRRKAEGRSSQAIDLPIPATAEVILRAMKPETFARFEGEAK